MLWERFHCKRLALCDQRRVSLLQRAGRNREFIERENEQRSRLLCITLRGIQR
jgi:hypothetical protein